MYNALSTLCTMHYVHSVYTRLALHPRAIELTFENAQRWQAGGRADAAPARP